MLGLKLNHVSKRGHRSPAMPYHNFHAQMLSNIKKVSVVDFVFRQQYSTVYTLNMSSHTMMKKEDVGSNNMQ